MDSEKTKQIELSQEKNLKEMGADMKLYSTDIPPDKIVENVGCELSETLTEWSNVLRQHRKIEEDTLAQLDDMLRQAFRLEAERLKERLEVVNKIIDQRRS